MATATRALRAAPPSWGGKALDAVRDPLYGSGYALVANTAGTAALGFAYWAIAAHLYDRQAVGRRSAGRVAPARSRTGPACAMSRQAQAE